MTSRLIVLGLILVLAAAGFGALADSSPGVNASSLADQVQATATPVNADPAASQPQAPAAAPEVTNRQDCGQIRGTDYLSIQERQWFLTNCVQR